MRPDDVEFGEIKRRGLRVGDVRHALLVHENAAAGADALGPAEVEHPARHVEHVDAHVADDAVAVFHERPPAARVHELVVGPHRRGAGPHFVIEIFRRHSGCRRIVARPHVVVAADLHVPDLAEQPGLDDLVARLDEMRRAAALRADLHHAIVFARRGEHRLAFRDIDADRLLAIDIRAGLHRLDHRQRVPMVGRADEHDVEVLLLEHLAIVARRCAASSPTSAARRRCPPRRSASSCPHRRARRLRPARPGSAAADRPCRTSRVPMRPTRFFMSAKSAAKVGAVAMAKPAAALLLRKLRRFMRLSVRRAAPGGKLVSRNDSG